MGINDYIQKSHLFKAVLNPAQGLPQKLFHTHLIHVNKVIAKCQLMLNMVFNMYHFLHISFAFHTHSI